MVGLIRSDTSNNTILLPEKHCGVDAKSGSGRWTKICKVGQPLIVPKYRMQHFGAVRTKWIPFPGHCWNQYWVYSGET
eukprot:5917007-Ditylum_brightwellii.AAC.1